MVGAVRRTNVGSVSCPHMASLSHNVFNRKEFTHWGRVTHICVGKQITIGSDNGLSPDRRQVIISTNARLLSIGPLRTYFSENLIKIQQFSLKKMHMLTRPPHVDSHRRWWLKTHVLESKHTDNRESVLIIALCDSFRRRNISLNYEFVLNIRKAFIHTKMTQFSETYWHHSTKGCSQYDVTVNNVHVILSFPIYKKASFVLKGMYADSPILSFWKISMCMKKSLGKGIGHKDIAQ